jgi:hypothetical protein
MGGNWVEGGRIERHSGEIDTLTVQSANPCCVTDSAELVCIFHTKY